MFNGNIIAHLHSLWGAHSVTVLPDYHLSWIIPGILFHQVLPAFLKLEYNNWDILLNVVAPFCP